jgi:hypothetical protein
MVEAAAFCLFQKIGKKFPLAFIPHIFEFSVQIIVQMPARHRTSPLTRILFPCYNHTIIFPTPRILGGENA